MKSSDTKLIRIPSRGRVVSSRGYVSTPITRPYRETVENIFRMLTSIPKPTILEVLPGGRTIELNTANFDKDNTLVKPEITPASVIPSVNRAENAAPVEKKEESKPEEPTKEPEAPVDPVAPSTEEPAKEEAPEEVVDEAPVAEAQEEAVEVEATEEVPEEVATENTATQEENRPQGKYNNNNSKKNKNKNKNRQQQNTTEATPSENVEVVPESVE